MLSRIPAFLGKLLQSLPVASVLRERVGLLETEKAQLKSQLEQRDATMKNLHSQVEVLTAELAEQKKENQRLQQWTATLNRQLDEERQAQQENRDIIPGADTGLY